MKPISYNQYRSTKSFNSRVRFLVFHYTATNFSSSVNILTGPNVSAHYLVPDITDPSYLKAGYTGQEVFNLVDETHRAWHAGVSQWGNRSNLNDTSIGIEIVNLATDDKGEFTFPPYHPEQIAAIEELALNILKRYPDITPTQVLGHSDISVGRKSDPGPAFPGMRFISKASAPGSMRPLGTTIYSNTTQRLSGPQRVVNAVQNLWIRHFGRFDRGKVLNSWCGHFRCIFARSSYDGIMDAQTAANLAALVSNTFLMRPNGFTR